MLDDLEDLVTERLDQFPGEMRSDALDHSAPEVFFYALEGARGHDLQKSRLELNAVLAVPVPAAARLDELTRLNGRR